jgi:cell division protein FtsQ
MKRRAKKGKDKARGRVRRKIVAAMLAVAALAGGGWALTHSSMFALNRIEVTGATGDRRAAVLAASGVRAGESALGLDLRAIEARVRALPWVGSVRVVRAGSLGIAIEVAERAAVARVDAGDHTWFVDRDGVPTTTAPAGAVPRIELPDPRALAVQGTTATERIADVLALWARLPAELRAAVRSFAPDAGGNIVFEANGTTVYFGDASGTADKLRAIELVRARVAAEHRRLRSINVMSPQHPAARTA